MFMLTHTYFLQKAMENAGQKNGELDAYIYNIAPDLLTIHPDISAHYTHRVKRYIKIPTHHSRVAFTCFHLFVDDLAHYGHICSGIPDDFKADSQGYCYLKGRDLIDTIIELHQLIQKKISYDEAVYQSHLIIEMIYDLVIAQHIDRCATIELLVDALQYTTSNKLDEFSADMNWLYGFEKSKIAEVMNSALGYVTKEGMTHLMNMKSRMSLYQDKFDLHSDEIIFSNVLTKMFEKAFCLIDDEKYYWRNPSTPSKNFKIAFLI